MVSVICIHDVVIHNPWGKDGLVAISPPMDPLEPQLLIYIAQYNRKVVDNKLGQTNRLIEIQMSFLQYTIQDSVLCSRVYHATLNRNLNFQGRPLAARQDHNCPIFKTEKVLAFFLWLLDFIGQTAIINQLAMITRKVLQA